MRAAKEIRRKTTETDIRLSLNLDDPAVQKLDVGGGFFEHMLTSFAKHGRFGISLLGRGDDTGPHHLVEDTGIVLGQALNEAAGDKMGIERFGSSSVPMDDALVDAAVDLSGRGYLVFHAKDLPEGETGLGMSLVRDFFHALSSHGRFNLNLNVRDGQNPHHVIEAMFKATAVALRRALVKSGSGLPTTKGML